jgi:hypothetical protein
MTTYTVEIPTAACETQILVNLNIEYIDMYTLYSAMRDGVQFNVR